MLVEGCSMCTIHDVGVVVIILVSANYCVLLRFYDEYDGWRLNNARSMSQCRQRFTVTPV